MDSMEQYKKDFSQYSFEDFLLDDYFVDSMNNPNGDNIAFWEKFQEGKPENITEFLSARLYMESIPVNRGSLSENEVSVLWSSIRKREKYSHSFIKRHRRLLISGMSIAAACIIGILFVPSFFEVPVQANADIYSFVSQNQETDFNSSSSRLILSEDKTVLLDEKESVITYDSENIKVAGNENLSKKESLPYNQLIVPKGKRSVLILSDGTKVWVNAGTRVVYPVEFNEKERELYVDGEVYMQVAHNKDWPFVVKTKDIGVSVLGTEFNVTAYESEETKRIILVSGSISITSKNEDKGILLSPNKMYQYNDNKGTIEYVDVSRYISWKDGIYIFENEKLAVIFDRLSRYYGKNIEFDPEVANMKCSGKLDLKSDLNDVLNGLACTAPIIYEKHDSKFLIKHKP
jgi:hypothetical protein